MNFHLQNDSFQVPGQEPDMPHLGLFSRHTLEPMIFSLGACDEREEIEKMIEEGGGILQNPKIPDQSGHRINLVEGNDNRVRFFKFLL